MSKNYIRGHKHLARLYPGEVATLEVLLTRLGLDLGDLTGVELDRWLGVIYSLKQSERGDQDKVIAGLVLAKFTLSTILRHEIGFHAKDPRFQQSATLILNGDPDGKTFEEIKGLRGLLDDILSFVSRGY